MDNFKVYREIQARTGGEIYIGVVGPVRTGKSTFIKRFMEQMVLPDITDEHQLNRTRDELPQSAAGKTIMTTEPKFIPKEAASVELGDGIEVKVRLVDCVGFMVDGAAGHIENEAERLVKTPWYETEIPFTKAAEIGTRKVIHDHSTIGIVITTDGSFGELPHESYAPAEEKTIRELKQLNKPFLVLLNSMRPYAAETIEMAKNMEKQHEVTVLPMNCEQLKREDIAKILELVLKEFPVAQLDFYIPKWLEVLPVNHWLKNLLIQKAREILSKVTQMKDVRADTWNLEEEAIRGIKTDQMDMSSGRVSLRVEMDDSYYYQIISDFANIPIEDEYTLMQTLKNLASMKKEYDKVLNAMNQVRMRGYGVVTPDRSEIVLDEPQVIKHGNKYGVKMRAEAPSINLIKANIQTEIAPIVGSEQQAKDLITYMKENARDKEDGIWETNIFGKSIEQIVDDGMQTKVAQMTEEAQMKLQDALQKIINDSNGGMICIII